jgi:hypothetical protein
MTSVVVITGVMDQLTQSSCSYINPNGIQYKADANPAMHYQRFLPNSCKLGNGMVVSIVAFTIFVTLSVLVRVIPPEEKSSLEESKIPTVLITEEISIHYDQMVNEIEIN